MTIIARSEQTDAITREYGGLFRRLYPWDGVATPPWGSAFMTVEPGQSSNPHSHDEEETFIFIAGRGTIHVDGQSRPVGPGDVVYLPRFSTHYVRSDADTSVQFLCIWWGAPEAEGAST